MTSKRINRHVESAKRDEVSAAGNQSESVRSPTPIEVRSSGGWLPPEDLREAALAAVSAGGDVALNLQGIEHLDASALQVLLALETEQKKEGRRLSLLNVSSHLRQWFDYSGAVDQFLIIAQRTDE